MDIKSRLDLTEVFCDVDDFYKAFQQYSQTLPLLTSSIGEKLCHSRLSLSEVMTIVIAFHGSGYRTFKEFYTLQVLPHWKAAFPKLVSYNRYKQGLQLITRYKKKMKQKLVKLVDKILLRKRSLIETVNDQLKNISQIEVRPRVVSR